MSCRWIEKVGLATVVDGRLLVVRRRGSHIYILPGGKPEGDETDLDTLAREIDEELGCEISEPGLYRKFIDRAAGHKDAVVIVRLYQAELIGKPEPRSEIEQLAWVDLKKPEEIPLAPSITNGILPHLRRQANRSALATKRRNSESLDGLIELC